MKNNNITNIADGVAGVTVLGTWLSYLPDIAAFLAIVWTLIRIYEWARVRVFGKPKDTAL